MNVSGVSKTVLVSFRDNKRPVTFISDNRVTETDSLIYAFKETCADVLGDENIHEVLLQIKDEDWDGEFVDLQGVSVSNRAVAKVLLTTSKIVSKLYNRIIVINYNSFMLHHPYRLYRIASKNVVTV